MAEYLVVGGWKSDGTLLLGLPLFMGRPGPVSIATDVAEPAYSREDTLAWLDLVTEVHWLNAAFLSVGTCMDTNVIRATSWHLNISLVGWFDGIPSILHLSSVS